MKNHSFFRIAWAVFLLLLCSSPSPAQTLSPYWAKRAYESMPQSNAVGIHRITTDKHGNSYAIINKSSSSGILDIDGHNISDNDAVCVLVSWDCNGAFRWMKRMGNSGTFGMSVLSLGTDTLEGVYIMGESRTSTSADTGTIYWDTDTAISVANGCNILYLMKYNSLGQLQWLRTPTVAFQNNSRGYNFSVDPNGDIHWFALLDAGVYDGGAFNISTRNYYAVQYNAGGVWQATVPLAISPPSTPTALALEGRHNPVTDRYYTGINFQQQNGNVGIGSTPLTPPASPTGIVATLASFDAQGNALWVRQANPGSMSSLGNLTTGSNGSVYISMSSDTGAVFCGAVTTNSLGYRTASHLMALDASGNLTWARYAESKWDVPLASVSLSNNILVAVGNYADSLVWGYKTFARPTKSTGYIVRVDAVTGAVIGLDTLSATQSCVPGVTTIDRNGNVFLGGIFRGFMRFAADTFSSIPAATNYYSGFIARYKNANCNCNLLQPAFTFTSAGALTAQFSYTGATPYASISWDFGDGSPTVSGANPQHSYATPGIYPTCVTVADGCGSNTVCQNISVSTTSTEDITPLASGSFYPNPATDRLYISGYRGHELSITDLAGRVLIREKNPKEYVNVGALNAGIYLLKIAGRVFKFIKE